MTVDKYLNRVCIAADVYAICLQHALTNEKQEIMGLLIGEVNEEECISYITACVILHRSDKQPDRVEISPEQLYTATMHAENLGVKLKKPMRVVGWYHSHPHITVWPSHVDIKTQATYQTMDTLFVGLIFSVYQSDPGSRNNQIQVTCFQAPGNGSNLERREVEIYIDNFPLNEYNITEITNLPKILIQEEVESYHVDDNNDDLSILHNDALNTLALVHIVSQVTRPLCDDLEGRLEATKVKIKEIKKIKKELEDKTNYKNKKRNS